MTSYNVCNLQAFRNIIFYVCIYVHVHVYVYTCVSYMYMYICVCIYMCICTERAQMGQQMKQNVHNR